MSLWSRWKLENPLEHSRVSSTAFWKIQGFPQWLPAFLDRARPLGEASRDLLPRGRSKENARHFSLCAQTIVDEDIRVTGTVTWQARPQMLMRANGDHKLWLLVLHCYTNSPGGFGKLLPTSRQSLPGPFWLLKRMGGGGGRQARLPRHFVRGLSCHCRDWQ